MSAVRDGQNINTEVRKEYVKKGRTSQVTGNSFILFFYTDYCSHRSNSSVIGFFPISNSSLQMDLLKPKVLDDNTMLSKAAVCLINKKNYFLLQLRANKSC